MIQAQEIGLASHESHTTPATHSISSSHPHCSQLVLHNPGYSCPLALALPAAPLGLTHNITMHPGDEQGDTERQTSETGSEWNRHSSSIMAAKGSAPCPALAARLPPLTFTGLLVMVVPLVRLSLVALSS